MVDFHTRKAHARQAFLIGVCNTSFERMLVVSVDDVCVSDGTFLSISCLCWLLLRCEQIIWRWGVWISPWLRSVVFSHRQAGFTLKLIRSRCADLTKSHFCLNPQNCKKTPPSNVTFNHIPIGMSWTRRGRKRSAVDCFMYFFYNFCLYNYLVMT